uniref:Uncharacterized protein n=1 Tax=Rhizophora mucronata TaxID=61149 RepID=A0A2P2NB81_RHIMU
MKELFPFHKGSFSLLLNRHSPRLCSRRPCLKNHCNQDKWERNAKASTSSI